MKKLLLKLLCKKEITELLERRQDYWKVMETDIKKFEYYQTRRCELERIINYLFGFKY